MDILGIGNLIKDGLDTVRKTVDDFHTSEEEKLQVKEKISVLENELTNKLIEVQKQELESKTEILKTDAKSDNWLLESWRPITILSLVGIYVLILTNNYIIAPAIAKYTDITSVQFSMPPDLGGIIKLILGTFTFGKSAEIVAGRVSGSHDSNRKEVMR
jgi:hypothetical protein